MARHSWNGDLFVWLQTDSTPDRNMKKPRYCEKILLKYIAVAAATWLGFNALIT